MLVMARKIANFVQLHSIFVICMWAVPCFFLFSTLLGMEILTSGEEVHNATNSSIEDNPYRDSKTFIPFILLPAACLTIFSRSIPVIFSISLSTFFALLITSSLSRLKAELFEIEPAYMVIVLHVTTANAIYLRRCWDKYRRAPCSSPIVRLLIATIDKSLPLLIATSTCASLIPLVIIIVAPVESIPISILILFLCVLQNVCTLSSILSILSIRNTYNWFIPNLPLGKTRLIQALIEEKLVYFAHFMCRIGKTFLNSMAKIPVVLAYLVFVLSYIIFNIIKGVEFVKSSIKAGKLECLDHNCYNNFILTISLFIVPLAFLCVLNRIQINTIISLIGISANLVLMLNLQEILKFKYSPIEFIMLSIIPVDGALRYCTAYRLSRKKDHEQKVLDMTDVLFSQITLASLCTACALGFMQMLRGSVSILTGLLIIIFTNWITVVVFYPSVIMLTGPLTFGKKRRGSQLSETRSINTAYSSHLMIDNPDYTKKYSTANYFGAAKQKRSYNVVITDSRRASMPVTVQKIAINNTNAPIFKKRSWATAGCYSVDHTGIVTMSPREALQMMRKEDSITSDNILIKELALI